MLTEGTNKKVILPALIGAGVCLFLQRSGFLSLFFLVPLGFVSFRRGTRAAWIAVVFAVLGNAVLSAAMAVSAGFPVSEIFLDVLYFSVMAVIFGFITAPPAGIAERVPVGVVVIAGSCIGATVFTLIFFRMLASPLFAGYMDAAINALISMYSTQGGDVVQNAMIETLTSEVILNGVKSVLLRGVSLFSCILLFFVSRQISLAVSRFPVRERHMETVDAKQGAAASLLTFRVYPPMIWVLSASLALLVLVSMNELAVPEIILWNVLVICVIVYFAQGLAILRFFLLRLKSPFMRISLYVLFFVLLFSPSINVILLGAVLLLGIAENWAPFRASKTNGTPSTPEAGDGGS